MFSTHLRHHPLWHSLSPHLLSTPSPWKFRETNFQTHHISLPLPITLTSQKNSSTLFILLVSPSDLSLSEMPNTIRKLERFSSLTGGANVLVAFILSEEESSGGTARTGDGVTLEMQAFIQLQNMCVVALPLCSTVSFGCTLTSRAVQLTPTLHSILTLPTPTPLIPIPSPAHLLPTLKSYISTLTTPPALPLSSATANPHLHLLSLCTTNPPLSMHSVFVLSDLFSSLRGMEVGTRSAEGRACVDDACAEGEEQRRGRLIGREVGEFWEEEVILE
jgi:hypothetical protein